jgi:nucleotide-binding universal stress UspA family protein
MMRKVLVPVDGSASSNRAVQSLIENQTGPQVVEKMEIHLLNVQHPLSGDVSTFVDHDEIKQYHHDEGLKALQSARQALDEAGVPFLFHVSVGNPAEIIVRFAHELKCDEILIGTCGHSALANLLGDAVASDVMSRADVPVKVVK